MNKVIKVRDLLIGKGTPKICVPVVGKTKEEILEEIVRLKNLKVDIVEWRADYYEHIDDLDKVTQILEDIRQEVVNLPILFTFRSKIEGGEKEISEDYYIHLIKDVCNKKLIDIVDIELFTGENIVKEIVEYAHDKDIKVIISNHDFDKTPEYQEIIDRLCKMQELGGDLPKIAVMPTCSKDVLTLLSATEEMYTKYATKPIITMSMGKLGAISRISGQIFGSSITFGSAKSASAPGQICVEQLYDTLKLIEL